MSGLCPTGLNVPNAIKLFFLVEMRSKEHI